MDYIDSLVGHTHKNEEAVVNINNVSCFYCTLQAFHNYARFNKCFAVSNKPDMNRLFIVALTGFVDEMKVGVAAGFLNRFKEKDMFVFSVSENVSVSCAMIEKIENLAKILSFNSIRVGKLKINEEAIGYLNKNRVPKDRFVEDNGEFVRSFNEN